MRQLNMTLRYAGRIRTEIASAIVEKRLTHCQIGDGSLSIREMICAVMLSIAHEYWVLKAAGLMSEEQRKHIEFALFTANSHHNLQSLGSLLMCNSATAFKTDESEAQECFSGVYSRIEEGASFLRFLDTLSLYPSDGYWRSVYHRLGLDYPDFDPDRVMPKNKQDIYRTWIQFSKSSGDKTNLSKPNGGAKQLDSNTVFLRWVMIYILFFLFLIIEFFYLFS